MAELKPCPFCGGTPEIRETFDTLRICCQKCGKTTPVIFGDYYDEGFMIVMYGDKAIEEWNRMADDGK